MSALRFTLTACAILALLPTKAPAADVVIRFEAFGAGPITYFQGRTQESTVAFVGVGLIELRLQPGVPTVVHSHMASVSAGSNDQSCTSPYPTEMRSAELAFSVAYVGERGTISRTVKRSQETTLFQICANQFQLDVAPSDERSLNLGSLGNLEITLYPAVAQIQANSVGTGVNLVTRFLLRAPD